MRRIINSIRPADRRTERPIFPDNRKKDCLENKPGGPESEWLLNYCLQIFRMGRRRTANSRVNYSKEEGTRVDTRGGTGTREEEKSHHFPELRFGGKKASPLPSCDTFLLPSSFSSAYRGTGERDGLFVVVVVVASRYPLQSPILFFNSMARNWPHSPPPPPPSSQAE